MDQVQASTEPPVAPEVYATANSAPSQAPRCAVNPFVKELWQGSCLHDLFYYVLNDSECHPNCSDFISCDCETHNVPDDVSEVSIEIDGCCHVRKGSKE